MKRKTLAPGLTRTKSTVRSLLAIPHLTVLLLAPLDALRASD